MAVLLTGASSAVGKAVAAELGKSGHTVRSTCSTVFPPDESTDALVAGVDVLIHLTGTGAAPPSSGPTDTAWLDFAVRDTYNLLRAAATAGVRKVVLATTLDCFLPYPVDSDCLQTGANSWPSWKPLPSTQPSVLGPHMAEFVAREFAHAQALRITIVRLGHLLWDVRGETSPRNLKGEPLRFSTTLAEAVSSLCTPVFETIEEDPLHLDWNDEGQRGFELMRYRVVHCGVSNAEAGSKPPLDDTKPAYAGGSGARPTVLITGGNGFLGPATVEAMKHDYNLRLSDVNPYGWRKNDEQKIGSVPLNELSPPHRSLIVDAADSEGVRESVAGTDIVINLAVVRPDRQAAFDVSTKGTYNAIRAAVDLGHTRFINTGPHFTHTGHTYTSYAHDISEEAPIRPGLGIYALSKGCGSEICRVFSMNHHIHVLTCLFFGFVGTWAGAGDLPLTVTYADAAELLRKCCEVDLEQLPSKFEAFFGTAPQPHGQYVTDKANRLLGWVCKDSPVELERSLAKL